MNCETIVYTLVGITALLVVCYLVSNNFGTICDVVKSIQNNINNFKLNQENIIILAALGALIYVNEKQLKSLME